MSNKKETVDIITREWSYNNIEYWKNPKDKCINAIITFNEKRSRLRAGILIIKDDEILLGEEFDEPGEFSLPGGGLEENETPVDAAKREAQEEVFINVKNAKDTEYDYCECYDTVKKWVKTNVPEKKWWYNYYTCLVIAEYAGDYFGNVDKVDLDKSMKASSRWYKIKDVINKPGFKKQWKKALIDFGYYKTDSFINLTEELETDIFSKLEEFSKKESNGWMSCYFGDDFNNFSGPLFLLPNGHLIMSEMYNTQYDDVDATHYDFISNFWKYLNPDKKVSAEGYNFLTILEEKGLITLNGGGGGQFDSDHRSKIVCYKKPTAAQIEKIREWLDNEKLHASKILVWCEKQEQTYDYDELKLNESDASRYIIKRILGYFAFGHLDENMNKKQQEELTRISDIIEQIKEIRYGFISKIDGKIIDDREWIHNCLDINKYYNVETDPEKTLSRQLGICQDQAIVIKYLFNKLHPEDTVKLYSLIKPPKGHCVACYCHDNLWYYLESSWDKERGLHGPFNSEEDVKNYLVNLYYKHHQDDTPEDSEVIIDDYVIDLQEDYKQIYDTIIVYVKNRREGGGWNQELDVLDHDISKTIKNYQKSLGWPYYVEYVGPGKTHSAKQDKKETNQLNIFDFDFSDEIKESKTLNEDTRSVLLAKSKGVDHYKHQEFGKNRFERKRLSKVINQVKMFNDLNMNTLVKQDTLLVNIPVQGETSQYTVSLQFEGVMSEIKNNVKLNKNKFEYKNVVQAITKLFNTANIKVKCTCDDFKYRYAHNLILNNNSIDDSSKDPGPGKTGMTAQMKGQGCKHILLVLNNQDWIMKLSSVISNYIKYMAVNQKDLFLRVIFPKLYGVDKDSAVENNLVQNEEMLDSSKDIIDTINKWSVDKGKFKPGSNKNTASKEIDLEKEKEENIKKETKTVKKEDEINKEEEEK